MARKRMIDPSFWDDLDVARLSLLERLLLIGLVSMADDYGHLPADPRYLRKQLFGYDDVTADDVAAGLAHLVETCRNVTTYTVDGQEYVALTKWDKYQKINHPSAPQYPTPDGLPVPIDHTNGHLPESSCSPPVALPDHASPVKVKSVQVKSVKDSPEEPLRGAAEASPPPTGAVDNPNGASPSKAEQHDALFEAVCTACGWSTHHLAEVDRTNAGKLARELGRADPPWVPRDVYLAGKEWKTVKWRHRPPAQVGPPTVAQLRTWLGECQTRWFAEAPFEAAVMR